MSHNKSLMKAINSSKKFRRIPRMMKSNRILLLKLDKMNHKFNKFTSNIPMMIMMIWRIQKKLKMISIMYKIRTRSIIKISFP